MFTDFYRVFYYCLLIIAAIIGLLYCKKSDTTYRCICLLLILTLISEVIAYYISDDHAKSNTIVYHIFTPIEYCIYAVIYRLLLNDKKWTRILIISIAGLIVAEILNTFFFQPFNEDPTNIELIESVLLVSWSLKLFADIKEAPVYENIISEGIFWFNSAVLFYYSFDILVWGLHNMKVYLLQGSSLIIYKANFLFGGLLYATFAVAVVLNSVSSVSLQSKTNE